MDLRFASLLLGQGVDSLKKRAQRGEFPAFKSGRDWRVTKDALINYIGGEVR